MQQTADEPLKSQPPLPLRTAGRGYGQADVATLVITCYSNLHTHTHAPCSIAQTWTRSLHESTLPFFVADWLLYP